ncbi:MAG: sulfotransferase [Congregibacter sp.]|nr:sulfotransferase [Congregibacter sp.]
MIHVVGMYKCGTSWLLHMLAAHPQVVGWREFDAIRAAYAPDRSMRSLPMAALDYLRPRPAHQAWMQRRERSLLRSSTAIFREMFAGRGWIPVMGVAKQKIAERLDPQDLDTFLEQLLALGNYRLRPDTAPLLDPASFSNTLGLQSFRQGDLLSLMKTVRDSTERQQIPTVFFNSLRSQVVPGTRIATKAADQLMQLSALEQASPGSRIIAIIRDGRDAAISARHFEALMRKRQAPWQTHKASYLRRLLGWSMRAAKLAEHARRKEITVLRYEDLSHNFAAICHALFIELGLDANADTIKHVQNSTDFGALTQDRDTNEPVEHELRKGKTGEWQQTLSNTQANLAWQLAGRSLTAFGYTPSGVVEPSSLVLGS